jgi:hypothetical protein
MCVLCASQQHSRRLLLLCMVEVLLGETAVLCTHGMDKQGQQGQPCV